MLEEQSKNISRPTLSMNTRDLGLRNDEKSTRSLGSNRSTAQQKTSADLEEKKAEIQAMLEELSKKFSRPTLSIYRKAAIYHFSSEGEKVT